MTTNGIHFNLPLELSNPPGPPQVLPVADRPHHRAPRRDGGRQGPQGGLSEPGGFRGLAEAHDSGIVADRRRDIASDLDNLTIADPTVNRSPKGARDAAEWMPTRHGAWFAERVIEVKLEYGLTVDPAERDALEALLAGGGAQLNCVD